MPTSAELGVKLQDERTAYATWLKSHTTDAGYDLTGEQVGEFNTRNETLAKMQGEYELALKIDASAAENQAKLG